MSVRYGRRVIDESRASLVLADVLRHAPEPSDDNGQFRIEQAWVEGDAIFVVYRGWWHDGLLGLRRPIEPGPSTTQIAGYLLVEELGEPPGSLIDDAQPDERGITWWGGNDPAWRDYSRYG
jgi:hypothetical protein